MIRREFLVLLSVVVTATYMTSYTYAPGTYVVWGVCVTPFLNESTARGFLNCVQQPQRDTQSFVEHMR